MSQSGEVGLDGNVYHGGPAGEVASRARRVLMYGEQEGGPGTQVDREAEGPCANRQASSK
jgi:hypothetical protein